MSSAASISRMQAWLGTCISSHPKCNRMETHPPPLPTRVIAVGGKRSQICHLLPGANTRGNYAALSHCWGSSDNQPLKTTDETLTLRQQGMKDEELPKTFRDAVQVCRELGIKYLWIDSLCIIQDQDSQEDWAREAPKMGDVYGNSVLTIFATASADSSEGLFRNRLGLGISPCPIGLSGQQYIVVRHPTFEKSSDPGDLGISYFHPLNHRGWVLQEQVLSRRSLVFTPDYIIWRCASMSTNEMYTSGIQHNPYVGMDIYRLLHCLINNIVGVGRRKPDINIYASWYRMIENFTSRKLTYQDDRLPAIAGLAKKFAAIANGNYYAGLWRGDLFIGLLWKRKILDPTKIDRTSRAPSWSWASVNVSIDYMAFASVGDDCGHSSISPLLDILDVSDPPCSAEHPFGKTSKATLRLCGALIKVVFFTHTAQKSSGQMTTVSPRQWRLVGIAYPYLCITACTMEPTDQAMRNHTQRPGKNR
ncbi:heterokaryon incompatibility protein [Rutstroemia sp. NJR-2017a BVV2]|nr:heterokaryon incompatibility protein [Rutstroemia sp. NJR-2017a BVV2]